MAFDDLARRMASSSGKRLGKVDLDFAAGVRLNQRRDAIVQIVSGVVLAVLGILLMWSAEWHGGTYLIAASPLIIGAVQLVRGFVKLHA
jgi:hypothetical protein